MLGVDGSPVVQTGIQSPVPPKKRGSGPHKNSGWLNVGASENEHEHNKTKSLQLYRHGSARKKSANTAGGELKANTKVLEL